MADERPYTPCLAYLREDLIQFERDPNLDPTALETDEEAQFDVVSVLSGKLKEVFESLPAELRNCSEFELCERVDPGPSDYKMRQNFSDAVAFARANNKTIRVTSIFEDVVSRQTFFEWYASNPLKIAFICRPVVPHHSYYEAIWKEGLRKMFLYVRKYDLDPKHMPQFMRIVEKAGDRVVGPVVQKIAMHQKQEVTHTSSVARDVGGESPEELEERIKEAQARLDKIKPVEIEARPLDQD